MSTTHRIRRDPVRISSTEEDIAGLIAAAARNLDELDDVIGAGTRALIRRELDAFAFDPGAIYTALGPSSLDERPYGSHMASGVLLHRPLLFVLTDTIDPDAVPNSVGTDPWVTAVEGTRTSDDVASEDLLAAFLFNRARGWRSRSAGRLFFLSVQRIHEAMAAARLSDAAWRLVGPKIPSSMWRDWDRCDRLRHAVVDTFLDRDLPPIEFGTVVDNGKLWWKLVILAAESSRGRRYLDKVRKALRDGRESWWAERANLIDRKVK